MVSPENRLHHRPTVPPSDDSTCILVTVDRISKACKLIPFKGLPTDMEILFHHALLNLGVSN